MGFFRVGPWLKFTRITGPQHNLLGLQLEANGKVGNVDVEVVFVSKDFHGPVLDRDEVVKNVLLGIEDANRHHGTSYVVTKVQFAGDDSPPESVYRDLARSIVAEIVASGSPGV